MKKLYVIGDSISMQYGPHLKRALRGVMSYARKDDHAVARLGLAPAQDANGGDSSMVLAFLQAALAAGAIEADVIAVNCGLHDIKTTPATGQEQVPLEEYRQNLGRIVAAAREIATTVVWIRTTPVDEKRHNGSGMEFHRFEADCDAYNRAADEIMAAFAVPAIDLHTFTSNLGDDLYADHVHFHDHVARSQASFIAGWLTSWQTEQAGQA